MCPEPARKNGKICVSIINDSVAEALAAAKAVENGADVIEIRLDTLKKPEIAPFMEQLTTPLLFTNRAQWEGGFYAGDEKSRTSLLLEAIDAKAAYVDIELQTEDTYRGEILTAARKSTTEVIVSWHNFAETPTTQELISVFQMMYRSGADIGKIVTMAHGYLDVLRVLDLQVQSSDMNFPLIAFCMGAPGAISRIATIKLGGYMTYSAPKSGKQAAPGQLAISDLQSILKKLNHGK
jgi:3-dehydroquinate dehydratase-1/3-dehydroquinate dehydratase/shikimate dehydrogenase